MICGLTFVALKSGEVSTCAKKPTVGITSSTLRSNVANKYPLSATSLSKPKSVKSSFNKSNKSHCFLVEGVEFESASDCVSILTYRVSRSIISFFIKTPLVLCYSYYMISYIFYHSFYQYVVLCVYKYNK